MLARNGSIASRKRYGDDDVKDDLKITIVRGISRQVPPLMP
jgi:sulfur carrier protein ThiS